MSRPFSFKQFTIQQAVNPQKVGTDSMLLGAWVKGNFGRILDIGTGTGILALMAAQNHPNADITAIEPDLDSLNEARINFKNAPFHNRILPIHCPLQQFGSLEKFDLIITNPPYFENSFLSDDQAKNSARHTIDLPVHELYEYAAELLDSEGTLALIIPTEDEAYHLDRAAVEELFPVKILRTVREDGSFKRSCIQYGFQLKDPTIETILVKNQNNQYGAEYIELTKDFYKKDLSQH